MYLCDQMWTRTYKLRRTSRWKVWQQTKWMQGRERERDSSEREGGRVVGQQTKRAEVLLGLGQTAFSYKVLRGDTTNTTAATAEGPQSGLRQYFWDWAAIMRNMRPTFQTARLLIARQTQSGQIDRRTHDNWVLKDNMRQTNTELPVIFRLELHVLDYFASAYRQHLCHIQDMLCWTKDKGELWTAHGHTIHRLIEPPMTSFTEVYATS